MTFNEHICYNFAMETKEIVLTVKGKLVFNPETESQDKESLQKTAQLFTKAANAVSQQAFDSDIKKALSFLELNDEFYHFIRDDFSMKSQMAQSVSKAVCASYKIINEQLKSNPWHYYDKETKVSYNYARDLSWLTHPVVYHNPFYDAVRNRDFTLKDDFQELSLNTVDGRINCQVVFQKYFKKRYLFNKEETWRLGGAKVFERNGEWKFHLSIKRKVEVPSQGEFSEIVGADRGIRFPVTLFDGKKTSFPMRGDDLQAKRDNYTRVRAELQSRGTKSAKRRLKKLSGRESRWMNDVNHRLSKTLASGSKSGTLLTLENLTGVSFSVRYSAKRNRDTSSWTFYDLETKMDYKMPLKGSDTVKVSPTYTSQKCPRCGHTEAKNRDHEKHLFECCNCGLKSNDDRIGAINIRYLGMLYNKGVKEPKLAKHNNPKFTEPAKVTGISETPEPMDDISDILI